MERRTPEDEPTPDGEEWVEWGEDLICAAGFTSGGAPYGITTDEFRRSNEELYSESGWVCAKRILERTFQKKGISVEVDWVKKVGEGLSRDIFAAHVELSPDPQGDSGPYAVLLPRKEADPQVDQRTKQEWLILERLSKMELPFRVPHIVDIVVESGRPVLVREFIQGIQLDLRAGRQTSMQPWKVVGEIAAAIHLLDVSAMKDVLPGHDTRRAHAEAELSVFDTLEGSQIEDVRDWARQNLPPDQPSVVIHGDLLGQNIILSPDEPFGVIDWEYSRRGDPAYDLAIVTRGNKRSFQIAGGMERLIEAYIQAGGISLTPADVHFYEIVLAARWYRNALSGKNFEPPAQALERLLRIARRSMAPQ